MGARDRRLGRGLSRTLLLLLVALVAAVSGAMTGGPAGAAKKAPPGDPPGNNGTVKIKQDDPPQDNTLDTPNEPHGTDCRIWLAFFGFDEGQKAIISFYGQAPSAPKDDTPVFEDKGPDGKGVDISSDAAAGGKNDPEPAYVPVNLAQAVKDAGLKEHPKQGYHLKLTTTINDKDGNTVPGGVKHKVFWMAPCADTAPPASSAAASTLRIAKEQIGAGQGPFTFELNCDHAPLNQTFTLKAGEKLDLTNVPPGTTCVVTETDKKGAESTTITEDPATGEADGQVKTVADKSTIVTFKNKFPGDQVVAAPPNDDIRPPVGTPAGSGGNPGTSVAGSNTESNPGTSVLGATETAPESAATLPRTGGNPRPLTAAGLWLVAAGGMALLAGRRLRRA